jgi:hypothetical protein
MSNETDLLAQGLKEYVDALHALDAFRELVKKKWRRVLEKSHRDYAAALRVKPSELTFEDYKWPGDGSEHFVGVEWTYEDPWAEILHCVMWRPGEEGGYDTEIYAGLWSPPKNRKLFRDRQQKEKIITDDRGEGPDVYIVDVLAPRDVGNIDVKLAKLTKKWITLWKNVGGLRVLGRK